jgi:phosphatidate cytidylyltransferase
MSSLVQRATTAFFFVGAMLTGIIWNAYSFIFLFALIGSLCLWEFFTIVLPGDTKRRWIGVILGTLPCIITAGYQIQVLDFTNALLGGLGILILFFLLFIHELFAKATQPFTQLAYLALGVLYIGIPFALLHMISFPDGTYRFEIALGLLVMNWMNDTGAYVLGSLIGKTPLFPRISPKKTWEGSLGGLLTAFIAALVFHYFTDIFSFSDWMALAAIVVIFGAIGDLIESMLKRSYDIKDSGGLLPGHGGFLDRFDAFIFLLPFAAFYIFLSAFF